MTTKCDIIRDVANATKCGMCAAIASNPAKPVPDGCITFRAAPPAAVCGVPAAANARMKLFARQYSPSNLIESSAARAARTQEESIYQGIIQNSEKNLATAYPAAAAGAAAISWPDFEKCLWNKNGTPGGFNGNKYFARNDATQLGMSPEYPLGGKTAEHTIWKAGGSPSPLPLTVDYVTNPDMFAIVMFALLVIILSALMWAGYKTSLWAPYDAEERAAAARERLEATDPYKGTAFETYDDKKSKCRNYVKKWEAQGYDMNNYRRQCGLAVKP